MGHKESLDALYEYADTGERVIFTYNYKDVQKDAVRTYEMWCDDCDDKHMVACSFGLGNPYDLLNAAIFRVIDHPLIEKGIITANDLLATTQPNPHKEQLNG